MKGYIKSPPKVQLRATLSPFQAASINSNAL